MKGMGSRPRDCVVISVVGLRKGSVEFCDANAIAFATTNRT